MRARLTEQSLAYCVVLLMFGSSAVADDEVFFDLSEAVDARKASSQFVAPPSRLTDAAFETAAAVTPPAIVADVRQTSATPAIAQVEGIRLDQFPGDPAAAPFDVDGLPENCPPDAPHADGLFGWPRPAPHYDLPSRSFSLFRSPVSYGWGSWERCAPTPWRPRGNGIPRRTSCERMDYRPYELRSTESHHGPAFYQRHELVPCPECHLHQIHLERYYGHGPY